MLESRNRMPLYWFHIDVAQQPHEIAARIESVVRDAPGWIASFREAWKFDEPTATPFIGTVGNDWFKIRRDIRYLNSFLPMISGRILPTDAGTRVKVMMYLEPIVALFDLIFVGALVNALLHHPPSPSIAWTMFFFALALNIGGFFPEAIKARRLLSDAILPRQDPAAIRAPARVRR